MARPPAQRRRPLQPVAALRKTSIPGLALVALTVAGCGGTTTRTSELRPPAPALLSAAVTNDAVLLSPRRIGGGPVTLAVTNQSSSRLRVTFASDSPGGEQAVEDDPGTQSALLGPGINAMLRANLPEGSTWSVTVDDETIDPAVLYVGPQRPSSQNDLMLP